MVCLCVICTAVMTVARYSHTIIRSKWCRTMATMGICTLLALRQLAECGIGTWEIKAATVTAWRVKSIHLMRRTLLLLLLMMISTTF